MKTRAASAQVAPESADGHPVEASDEAASHIDATRPGYSQHGRHRPCFATQLTTLQAPIPAIKMHAQPPAFTCTIL